MGVCVACFDEKLVDVYCQSANIFGTGENGFLYRFCINGTFYVLKGCGIFLLAADAFGVSLRNLCWLLWKR